MMIPGTPNEWLGKRYRNVHTDQIAEVDQVGYAIVSYHDINDPSQAWKRVHASKFKEGWEPMKVSAAQGE